MEVLMHTIQLISPCDLKPNPRNARTHSKKQIRQIARQQTESPFGATLNAFIDSIDPKRTIAYVPSTSVRPSTKELAS
jgi:hypothetical protein